MRYYIADLHFFHQAMNTHMDKRGFEDIHQMNTYMIEKWNQKVRKKDEVVILGDLSWGNVQDTNGQYHLTAKGIPKTYMLYGHVHDTKDQRLVEQFQQITRQTVITDVQGNERHIPCNMINCFCMYSDYEPWSLDEWIQYYENRSGARS